MRILDRYIFRESLSFFGVSIFAFTGLLLTLRMLRLASLVINRGVQLSQVGLVMLSIIPTFLEIALPMATLLGVMLAFARLSGDSEVVVLRGSGVSIFQLIRPVILFGLAVGALNLYVSLSLRPWGFRTLDETLFDIAKTKSTAGLTEGVFNKLGALTLYSEQIDHQSGKLGRVLVDDKRQGLDGRTDESSRRIIVAKRGVTSSNPAKQTITINLWDGTLHEVQEGNYLLTNFDSYAITLGADELYDSGSGNKGHTARILSLSQLDAEEAQYVELLRGIDSGLNPEVDETLLKLTADLEVKGMATKEVRRKLARIRLERQQRFSLPYASFVMALLALPLGILPPRTQRQWGAGISMALGLGIFTFYYATMSVGITLVEQQVVHPFIGMWIPNLICTLLASLFIVRIGNEQWQSIGDGIGRMFDAVRRVTSRAFGRRPAEASA